MAELLAGFTHVSTRDELQSSEVFDREGLIQVILGVDGYHLVVLVHVVKLKADGEVSLAEGFVRLVDEGVVV